MRWPIRHSDDDSGQTLVLVMLVTFLVMLMAGTSMTITASNIKPADRTADVQAAFAAAQGGVDEFGLALTACGVDWEDASCQTVINSVAVHDLKGADDLTRATYAWKLSETPNNERGVFRVTSTGQVKDVVRSLVADFRPTPSFVDYLYFTEVEAISPELALRYFGPRTIQIPSTTFRSRVDAPRTGLSSATWSGAQGADVCGLTWYDSAFAPGRSTLRTLHGGGLPAWDYRETTTSPVTTRSASCDVVFANGQSFGGRVYSKDAFLVAGSGPMFLKPIRTEWSDSKTPAPAAPKYYRESSPGDRPASGSELPKIASGKMSMPNDLETVEADATCVFTGPTRIKLAGATAVVTSPLTTTAMLKPGCSPGVSSGLLGSGLVQVSFPITQSTSYYVKNTTPVTVATPTNPLFDLRSVTIGAPAAVGQPATFYTEMNSAALPVNVNTLKAVVTAAPLNTMVTALDTWLGQVNGNRALGILVPQYRAIAGTAVAPATVDPLLEPAAQVATVQRRTCILSVLKVCLSLPVPSAWTTAFTVTRATHTFPLSNDATPYETGLGSAFVEGNLTGKLTIAAENDVVITESTTYNGTAAIPTGTLGLVADRNVEIYHPVSCVAAYTTATTAGYCPNDLTGLDSSSWSDPYHPSKQYDNIRGIDLNNIEIDAAILARNGSFTTQNYMRGDFMGTNTVTGGVYQEFRGPNGISGDSAGYITSMYYDPRLELFPPPNFVVPEEALTTSAWMLLGIAGLP